MKRVVMLDACGQGWWLFQQPRQVIQAWAPAEVLPALREIETAVESRGLWAAGFISYEAAPAFDSALQTRPDEGFPLLGFGLYPPPQPFVLPPPTDEPDSPPLDWQPSVAWEEYARAIELIKQHIARGDTYQVNYTLRLRAAFPGDPWALFLRLAAAQPTPYAAYIDAGAFALCSASPELFFRLDGDQLTARPMKGTAPRGRTLAEDCAQAEWLQQSEKNRAENVMIVDMLRNDLGRVAQTGSVQVLELFQVERYPTLWQMTSIVQARSHKSFSQVLTALFPCASITGAPKPRTMRIIAALEATPRRAYTGCIGYYAPGRQARFSVAIRTVCVDRRLGQAEYGAGGGIVWDSTSAGEYDECLLKAHLITQPRPQFELLETMLWTAQGGFYLLEEHLQRLAESAEYFAFALDLSGLRLELNAQDARLRQAAPHPPDQRVRLLLASQGQVTLQALPLPAAEATPPLHLGIAAAPVDSSDPFLYHKTTRRQVYQDALVACPGCDDVLLWNERREVTETTIANLVYRLGGRLYTPPVSCGLLPGTLRGHVLAVKPAQGRVLERVLTLDELPACQELWLINSVRGWRRAVLASTA